MSNFWVIVIAIALGIILSKFLMIGIRSVVSFFKSIYESDQRHAKLQKNKES